MARIDQPGTYRGTITEAAVNTTKKGYPQFVARLQALEKFVDDAAGMEHFELEEPGWVDWSSFNEETTGFFVLFNDPDVFNEDTSLLNYEQLQLALGWDGTEFDSLADDSYVGSKVLFRMDEDEYNGEVKIRANWIDAYDASPVRELRKLDQDEVKDLSSKLKIKKKAKPATAAKPAKKAEKPAKEEAKEEKAPPKKSPPKPPSKKAESKPEEKPEEVEETASESLPDEVEQVEAWEWVCDNKGGNTDSDVEEAWIAACNEVGEDKDEDDFTKADWAKVRDLVIKDLALDR